MIFLLAFTQVQASIDPTVSLDGFVNALVEAAKGHHWPVLAALLLIGAVQVLRWVAAKRKTSKLGAFLSSNRGGSLLAILLGVSGAYATALATHMPISLGLTFTGALTGVLASGLWNVGWDIAAPNDKKVVPAPAEAPAEEKKEEVKP